MTKRILTLVCFAALYQGAQAQTQPTAPSAPAPAAAPAPVQESSKTKVRLGLFVAPNIGWEKTGNDGISSDGGKLGYCFGLNTEFQFSKRYALATGLHINKMGYGNTQNIAGIQLSTTTRSQYVEIPVTLKLSTNEIGYLTYFGKFGLAPSLSISDKFKDSKGAEGNLTNQIQPLRMALIIGFGAEYSISGDTRLFAGLDFNNGFTNVYTRNAVTDAAGNKRKSINNFVSLQLGVFF
ncbi:MAG TPA: porin family protein [Luteibaculaceae bacterium]|nr:porin family protein [Luteibaculaceae bacterium]